MSDLKPQESMLVGRWIASGGQVQADEICKRIDRLTDGELEFVGNDPEGGGWVRLFRDPADARYWELTYPQGYSHGGGPPTLRYLSDEEVAKRYGLD